jgi:hypothetical protein
MKPEELIPGTLVRYDETTTRWYIATVRSIVGNTVTLEYLSRYREEVERAKVRSFRDFLSGREKVMSRKREDLCRLLYRKQFDRLPLPRLKEIQTFLRENGLRYSPQDWPRGAQIKISLDTSFVACSKPAIDSDLDALLPRWLEPNRLPPGSRDPLGFQSHAERLANEILPGLTVFTSRIGYYGFIAWAVNGLNVEKFPPTVSRREIFHRLERTLALCEFIQHGQEDRSCRLLGQRSKSQILQSAVGDRFYVPKRILKNQESAGAFRLYSTSLESAGFATSAPELAADKLLPLELTDLGKDLADEFRKCVPDGFWEFAMSDKAKDRDTLRSWGKNMCFLSLGKRYRDVFIEGFLRAGARDAEARYHTVQLLFKRGMLSENYEISKRRTERSDSIAEDDVSGMEDDPMESGLDNRDALLRFYGEKPKPENASLQKAAVFELLSLAHTAIFAHAIHALDPGGRASVQRLAESIVADRAYGALWKIPFDRLADKAVSVRVLEQSLIEAEDPTAAAALSGVLMARVQADGAYAARAADLADTPVMGLLRAIDPKKSLAEGYADFLQRMVDQHIQVSKNKNRQRWCYMEPGELVKDDLRQLSYGWHSMRFPQLWSLCRDLRLTQKDISNGR